MRREEAFNKLKKYQIDRRNPKLVALKVECYDLINEIYKNLEEKICKNCKYFEKDYCTHMENTKMNEDTMIMVDENFSCNRFERR